MRNFRWCVFHTHIYIKSITLEYFLIYKTILFRHKNKKNKYKIYSNKKYNYLILGYELLR